MSVEDPPIASVWARPRKPRREQPALSRDQIVAAAIALLDSAGFEALSMRKLGAELNAGATSLYTHVANRDELIELVADAALGALPVPDPADPRGWRAAVTDFTVALRRTMLRHPWLSSMIGEIGTLYLGPNMMRGTDGFLGVLERAGMDSATADLAMSTILGYAFGITMSEAASLRVVQRSGLSEAQWYASIWPAAESAARGYPYLHKRYSAPPTDDLSAERDELFVRQLEFILDGLEGALRGTD
ncbi:TetR/AcrR family transcriptional regulator [Nocardia brasiliensis]